MKKFGLIALLGVLSFGLVACGNTSTPGPVEAQMPVAWAEGATYQAEECSISLVPGSLENPDAKPVKDFMYRTDVRCFDLRDVKEGYGVGHIQGFESVSYFNTIVGDGEQLFSKTDAGFVARYEE